MSESQQRRNRELLARAETAESRTKELEARLERVRVAVESARGGTSFDHARALEEIDEALAKIERAGAVPIEEPPR